MSLELTGVHGLLKRHKLFTHKYLYSLSESLSLFFLQSGGCHVYIVNGISNVVNYSLQH